MAKRTRGNKTRKGRSNRRYTRRVRRGGGWGFTGLNSIPGTPGTVSNPQVFTAIGDCRAERPGYEIPYGDYAKYQGLPGMNGGRRKSRRAHRGRKALKGGRYTFNLDPTSVAGVSPNAAPYWAGTYPPVQRIACEGSTPNPLNPGPHTPSTQPTPVASANLHLNPQSGGAQNMAPATYGVGNVDSMYYYAPTAGYDNKPSTWVDSVGAPVQLQIPYAAREMNPACLTTGHPPPLTGALQKVQAGGNLTDAMRVLGSTFTGTARDLTNTTTGLVKNTASTATASAQQLGKTAMNMGQNVALTVTGRGGQVGGSVITNTLTGATGIVGDFVKGTTGTMSSALTGVAGASGSIIQGTTGAAVNATTGLAKTVGNFAEGTVNTAKAVLQGGARRKMRKSKKTRKAHKASHRK